MKLELNFDRAAARLESLPAEYAADPRTLEGADTTYFDPDLYDRAEDGHLTLSTARRDAALQELQALRLQHENEQLREQANRRTVVDELRRSLRAVGVKPGLIDAAAAMFMQTHRFGIDPDTGKVSVLGQGDNASDCLQAAVRFVERDEHADLKARSGSPGRGEFAQMAEALQH